MDASIWRAVDANLNRAAEGMRVCEDVMRFSLGDTARGSRLKDLRHVMAVAARAFPAESLLGARDVEGDAQKFYDLESEKKRGGIYGLFRANIRRAAEACRAIEEFSKLAGQRAAAEEFQRLRFALYDEEKAGLSALSCAGKTERFRGGGLYAILDPAFFEGSIESAAGRLVDGGAVAVQLRMKTATSREFLEEARVTAGVCREGGALFIVNDRPDIAVLSGADGVHLGQEDISCGEARRVLSPGMIVGVSTRTAEQAVAAARAGADYVAVGPVFGTTSKHPEPMTAIGAESLAAVRTSLPGAVIVAIGGIDAARAEQAVRAGADSVAVISALYRNDAIEENCRGIIEACRGGAR